MRTPDYEMRRFEADPVNVYWVDRITGAIGGRMKFDEFTAVVSNKPKSVYVEQIDRFGETEHQRILNDINETLAATFAKLKPPPPEAYIVGLSQ
jgi:hypothetical protein